MHNKTILCFKIGVQKKDMKKRHLINLCDIYGVKVK